MLEVLEAVAVVLNEEELNMIELARLGTEDEPVLVGGVTVREVDEEEGKLVEDSDDGGRVAVGVVAVEDGVAVVEVIVDGGKGVVDEGISDVGAGDVRPPQVHGPSVPSGI